MLLPDNLGTPKQKEFNDVLSRNFEDGTAMEIIDGDIDSIEKTSFTAVMEWVQR